MTGMTVRRIAGPTALVAALLATLAVASPVAAAPASPQVVRAVQQDTAEGRELAIRVTGIPRATPVRIAWGDGSTSVLRTTCTAAAAMARPQSCAATATQVYATDGTYRVRVTAGGRVLHRDTVTVSSAAPATPAAEGWQEDMLASVNALRAAAGVAPLTLCAPLNRASADYARVMASQGWFDHTGPDGRQPWDRMAAAGYDYRAAGENIAAGQPDVRDVMAAWRDSPGHYANIVSPNFRHLGVGRAASSDQYGIYWVQNFGAGGSC